MIWFLIHSDKQVLLDAIESIRFFLKERLHLILHPRKIRLQLRLPWLFLGAYLYRTAVIQVEGL